MCVCVFSCVLSTLPLIRIQRLHPKCHSRGTAECAPFPSEFRRDFTVPKTIKPMMMLQNSSKTLKQNHSTRKNHPIFLCMQDPWICCQVLQESLLRPRPHPASHLQWALIAAIVTELRCVDMSEPVQRDEHDANGCTWEFTASTFPMVSLYEANLLLRKL